VKPAREATVPVATPARVEFTVQFSRGPKGRRRVSAEQAPPVLTEAVTPEAAPSRAAPWERPTPAEVVLPPTPPTPAVDPIPTSPRPAPPSASELAAEHIPKITLLLVLGHHFERLVRDGVVKDLADIARRTGLTRARVSQITGMTMLAPDIQEAILDLKLTAAGEDPVHERSLRKVVSEPSWRRQRKFWSALR